MNVTIHFAAYTHTTAFPVTKHRPQSPNDHVTQHQSLLVRRILHSLQLGRHHSCQDCDIPFGKDGEKRAFP
jgi:hypothetical protein